MSTDRGAILREVSGAVFSQPTPGVNLIGLSKYMYAYISNGMAFPRDLQRALDIESSSRISYRLVSSFTVALSFLRRRGKPSPFKLFSSLYEE